MPFVEKAFTVNTYCVLAVTDMTCHVANCLV